MRTLIVLVIACALPSTVARAEKVDMSPAQLKSTATDVVTGEVKAIYVREKREGKWAYKHHVAEVAIKTVEKGDGLEKGGLVYVRYWTRHFVGSMPPPSTNGHRGIPKEGETLRIYLARNAYDGFGETKDGGFNVIGANGFERLAPQPK